MDITILFMTEGLGKYKHFYKPLVGINFRKPYQFLCFFISENIDHKYMNEFVLSHE